MPPSFGAGSFARHAALARAAGAEVKVRELPSLGLDVDTPDDLAALRAALDARPDTAAAHARRAAPPGRHGVTGLSARGAARACPRCGPATTSPRCSRPPASCARPTCSPSPTRSSPRPRAGSSRSTSVVPGDEARRLADEHGKDPRHDPGHPRRVRRDPARRPRPPDLPHPPRLRVRQRRRRRLQRRRAPARSCCCPPTPTPPPARSAPARLRRDRSPTPSAARGASARPRSRSAAPASRRPRTGAGAPDADGRELAATVIADRRRGGRRRRPRPRQGHARARDTHPRARAPRHGRRRPRRRGAGTSPRGRPVPLGRRSRVRAVAGSRRRRLTSHGDPEVCRWHTTGRRAASGGDRRLPEPCVLVNAGLRQRAWLPTVRRTGRAPPRPACRARATTSRAPSAAAPSWRRAA